MSLATHTSTCFNAGATIDANITTALLGLKRQYNKQAKLSAISKCCSVYPAAIHLHTVSFKPRLQTIVHAEETLLLPTLSICSTLMPPTKFHPQSF